MRLRPLSEAECYVRCYGVRRGEAGVPILPPGLASRLSSEVKTPLLSLPERPAAEMPPRLEAA